MELEGEYEYEYEFDAERMYEHVRHEIGAAVSTRLTDALAKRLRKQFPQGLETGFTGRVAEIIESSMEETVRGLSPFYVLKSSIDVSFLKPSTQERSVGSDVAIFFEVLSLDAGIVEIIRSKTLLVQAKVGSITPAGALKAGDALLPDQLAQIQRVSPDDGYLLVYTEHGGFCVPVVDALRGLRGRTVTIPVGKFFSCGHMLHKLIICESGDPNISPVRLNASRLSSGELDLQDATSRLVTEGKLRRLTSSTAITLIARP